MEYTQLYHHGIKGMRWGVRRTEAQLQRVRGKLASLEEKYNRQTGRTPPTSASSKKKKSLSEMDDDELNSAITRLQKEKQYKALMSELNPQKTSKGKQFISDMFAKSITPALQEAGKQLLKDKITDIGKKKLGLKDGEADYGYQALKKEVDMLELHKKKAIAEDYLANRKAKQDSESKSNSSSTTEKPKSDSSSTFDKHAKTTKDAAKAVKETAEKTRDASKDTVTKVDTKPTGQDITPYTTVKDLGTSRQVETGMAAMSDLIKFSLGR